MWLSVASIYICCVDINEQRWSLLISDLGAIQSIHSILELHSWRPSVESVSNLIWALMFSEFVHKLNRWSWHLTVVAVSVMEMYFLSPGESWGNSELKVKSVLTRPSLQPPGFISATTWVSSHCQCLTPQKFLFAVCDWPELRSFSMEISGVRVLLLMCSNDDGQSCKNTSLNLYFNVYFQNQPWQVFLLRIPLMWVKLSICWLRPPGKKLVTAAPQKHISRLPEWFLKGPRAMHSLARGRRAALKTKCPGAVLIMHDFNLFIHRKQFSSLGIMKQIKLCH